MGGLNDAWVATYLETMRWCCFLQASVFLWYLKGIWLGPAYTYLMYDKVWLVYGLGGLGGGGWEVGRKVLFGGAAEVDGDACRA